ncbi:integrating conjugative element protein [Gallibacterium anatis]|uniref:integrating conjugative element protein n=1 Tax=Gallibacterium anatis TaxID=750 RepID=UPI001FF0B627|nr:integrating conjugative element protein [Gallibacterium anatis]
MSFLLPTASYAAEVIADEGGESALRFYEPIQPVIEQDDVIHSDMIPPIFHEKDLLPIVSHLMTPGKINIPSRMMNDGKVKMPGMQPLCLIGDDALSEDWFRQKLPELKKMAATCLVVNVQQYERLQQLRNIDNSIPLLPVSADDLAKRLKIVHYPVLITEKGIEQ